MDSLDPVQKEKSFSFANAMNAIEGIPISQVAEQADGGDHSKYEQIGDCKVKDYKERPHEYVGVKK